MKLGLLPYLERGPSASGMTPDEWKNSVSDADLPDWPDEFRLPDGPGGERRWKMPGFKYSERKDLQRGFTFTRDMYFFYDGLKQGRCVLSV